MGLGELVRALMVVAEGKTALAVEIERGGKLEAARLFDFEVQPIDLLLDADHGSVIVAAELPVLGKIAP